MAERRESLPAHPLFPSLGDEPPPRVESIHVTRLEGGRPVYYVRRFGPDELTGLDQIAERFGGGLYELVAYASAGISARRKYELPGRSRPMHEDPSGAADTAGPVLAAPAAAAAPAGGDASFMLGLLQLQAQQNQSMMALMMQGQQESTKALASIVGAALSNRGGGDEVAGLIMRSADRQFELMSKLLGGREVSGSSAVALLERGVKLGREFADAAAGDDEEDEAESIEGHIDAVGRMMGQVQALAGGDAAGGGLFGTAPVAQTGAPEPPDVDSGAE